MLRPGQAERAGDEKLLEALKGLAGECALVICEVPDAPPSVRLTLERSTWPTALDDYCITEIALRSDAADPEEDLADCVETAERQAASSGAERILASLDIVDANIIRAFERLGYRASGQGPYRLISGSSVEYLIGYTDCVGFRMDYSRAL